MIGTELGSWLSGALFVALLAGVSLYPMLRHRRAGWLGVPLGTAVGLFAIYQFASVGFSGSDLLPLAVGTAMAAFAGWRLPWPDSGFSVVGGPALALLLMSLLGGGADNPVPLLVAACGLGFMVGGIASAAASLVAARQVRKAPANG
ncbi:MAG TPA: hypothetical protein VGB08_06825 [Allosphingosinicella sp.]|jgi:hypothetical protein